MNSKPAAVSATATVGTNGGSRKIGHGAVRHRGHHVLHQHQQSQRHGRRGPCCPKKALEKGLHVKPYVKTSLAPGSRVVTDYLKQAGLIEPLSKLGFNIVAYGCTTCIGNSGPLPGEVAKAVTGADLVAAAVLSGNRNFEGRINPLVRASYLASPPLVVAFALAGRVDIDLDKEPLGTGSDGQPVFLRDLWPTQDEITEAMSQQRAERHVHRQIRGVSSRALRCGRRSRCRRAISTSGTRPPPTSIIRLTSRTSRWRSRRCSRSRRARPRLVRRFDQHR